jgi:hypothetical protein
MNKKGADFCIVDKYKILSLPYRCNLCLNIRAITKTKTKGE